MHIQIINFHLKGLSEGDFRAKCDEIAPLYAELPGLISKVWLANSPHEHLRRRLHLGEPRGDGGLRAERAVPCRGPQRGVRGRHLRPTSTCSRIRRG